MSLPNPNKPLHPVLEGIANKMKNGYSPLICIVGDETGIGKSMFGARIAELIYNRAFGERWTPKDNVFFSMKEFKPILFSSKQRIFILEEAEIELGSDEWTSIANRWFSRMKSTQRIKGNLYMVILPIFLQLARKHRRAVNYLFDIKGRGYAHAYKIKKFSAQVLGDEMARIFLGGIHYNLPDCKNEYDLIDHQNKKKIEARESERFDIELERAVENDKKYKEKLEQKKNILTYVCHNCGNEINSKTKIDGTIKCKKCKNRVYINESNLK